MKETSRISGVIITFNEEANIERCISSMEGVVDEIVVVDSYSTDNTMEICRKKGVRLIQQRFLGYIEQKNFAMNQAHFQYVLSLDADEALSESLRDQIPKLKPRLTEFGAYGFHRLNNYCGKWLHHGNWYPDKKVRLWDKTKYKWGGTNPHDRVITADSAVKWCKSDILHFSYSTVEEHIVQIQKFAMTHALSAHKKGKRANLLVHVILNPLYKFVKRYFIFLGFLDGYYGFVAAINSALLNYLKYVYLLELNKSNKH